MSKTSIFKLKQAERELKAKNFHKKHCLDFFIIKVLEENGKFIDDTVDGYSVYSTSDGVRMRYIVAKGIKRQTAIAELSPKEVILLMQRMLPEEEFKNWVYYNIGLIDILKCVMNPHLRSYKALIENFVNNPNKFRLDELLPETKISEKTQLRISQKVLMVKHRQYEKIKREAGVFQERIMFLESQITKQSRREILDTAQKTLPEVLGEL
jgi:predicted metal-dependent hydrolase